MFLDSIYLDTRPTTIDAVGRCMRAVHWAGHDRAEDDAGHGECSLEAKCGAKPLEFPVRAEPAPRPRTEKGRTTLMRILTQVRCCWIRMLANIQAMVVKCNFEACSQSAREDRSDVLELQAHAEHGDEWNSG